MRILAVPYQLKEKDEKRLIVIAYIGFFGTEFMKHWKTNLSISGVRNFSFLMINGDWFITLL